MQSSSLYFAGERAPAFRRLSFRTSLATALVGFPAAYARVAAVSAAVGSAAGSSSSSARASGSDSDVESSDDDASGWWRIVLGSSYLTSVVKNKTDYAV